MLPHPDLLQSCLADGDAMAAVGNHGAALACWLTVLEAIETCDAAPSDPILRVTATILGRIALFELRRGALDRALGAATLAVAHLESLQDIALADAGAIAALRCKTAMLLLDLGQTAAAMAALAEADSRLALIDSPSLPCAEIALQRVSIANMQSDILLGSGDLSGARRLLLIARAHLRPLLDPVAPVDVLTAAIDIANRLARLALLRADEELAQRILDEAEALAECRVQRDPGQPAPDIGTARVAIDLARRKQNVEAVREAVDGCLGGIHLAAHAGGTIDWINIAALSRAATAALLAMEGPTAALSDLTTTLHRLRAIREIMPDSLMCEGIDALVAIELERIDLLEAVERTHEARAARDAARRWVLGEAARGAAINLVTLSRLGL